MGQVRRNRFIITLTATLGGCGGSPGGESSNDGGGSPLRAGASSERPPDGADGEATTIVAGDGIASDASGDPGSSSGVSSPCGGDSDSPTSPSYGPCDDDCDCPDGETCSAPSNETAPQCRAACTNDFECPPPDGGDTFTVCHDGLCAQWCSPVEGPVSGECGPNHMCFVVPGFYDGVCGLPP
jgi:hypothetical protein